MSYDNTKLSNLEALEALSERINSDFAKKADIPQDVSQLGNTPGYQTKGQVDAAIKAQVASTYKPGGTVTSATLPTPSESNLGMVYNVSDEFTTTTSFLEGAGHKHPAGTNIAVIQEGSTYKFDVLAGFIDLSGYASKAAGAVNGNLASLDANGNPTDSGKKPSDFVAAVSGKGLSTKDFTAAYEAKLKGIQEGATKVEQSSINGNIKVNGSEMTVYTPEALDFEVATKEEVSEMLDKVFGAS